MTYPRDTRGLEDLPLELKCAILEHITDIPSLRNLVHASPDYHAAYLSAREAIHTRVTFHDLSNRKIDLSNTTALVHVCHIRPNHRVSQDAKWTLRQLRRHDTGLEELRTIRGGIVLNIQQCRSLLSLRRVIWKPFPGIYNQTEDLFPKHPIHAFADEGYILQQYNRHTTKIFRDTRYTDAGWDAYYLDEVRDGRVTTNGLEQRILRHVDFFLFYPGEGGWWNLVPSALPGISCYD
ncbi:MAG: hypothetical protein HETSPECPRED_002936 [Heterodermia speciosa]|uniref:Uncharacterized protein n=1 Tax=Heterodermia speciosa TaxID=116794 RepID=A0A8H3F6I2_9LECA|nr:MAG: hypothetical protein HETSPECPRED_002936 [Heterodermia speciosa]